MDENQRERRTGGSRRLIVVCLAIALATSCTVFLTYVLRSAALNGPRATDGHVVLPVPERERIDGGRRMLRQPRMSVLSLENHDESSFEIKNWDAALTLAKLSSEVYFDTRVDFAEKTLGFDVAVPIDRGARHSLVCSNDRVIVVAFRGTETVTDMLLDSTVLPVRIGLTKDDCAVHAGFHLACTSLYKEVVAEIERQGGRKKQLHVTGHSLGGAMAIVFAYIAQSQDGFDVKSVVTFGQPLAANENFAGLLVTMFRGRHRRFVHRDDLVSRVARPYFHSGARILLVENQRPLFWSPGIITQSPAGGAASNSPAYTLGDPVVTPLSEEQLIQVKQFAESTQLPEKRRDRRRRSARAEAGANTEIPPHATTSGQKPMGHLEWIRHGLEDHKMEHYINCIEAQEMEVE